MAAIVQDLSRLEKAVDILDAIYRHRKQNPTTKSDEAYYELMLDYNRRLLLAKADGRPIGSIVVNDIVDGSKVIITELVPYNGNYTYDILPSGETRTYWADGVLLKSTIRSD